MRYFLTGMRHVSAQAPGFPASAACQDKQEMEGRGGGGEMNEGVGEGGASNRRYQVAPLMSV